MKPLLMFALFVVLAGCEINNSFTGDASLGNTSGPAEYQAAVKVMSKNACFTCHSDWSSFENDADYLAARASQFVAGDGATSNFYLVLKGQGTGGNSVMPPSGAPVSAPDAEVIKAWIDAMTPATP